MSRSWYADPAKLMRMGDSEELDRLMEEHANYCHNDREALMEGIKAAKEDRCVISYPYDYPVEPFAESLNLKMRKQ